jgi:phosphoribosylaminoimidazolecarboxamide formyltransferase / IMP cyclohydrolase
VKIGRALISVFYKDGLVELAKYLHQKNIEIISSGGTSKVLEENNIPTISVSSITDFPEILGGRVKTLHPKIFGGILHKDNADHLAQIDQHGINAIDLVIVNLYPFEETIANADCSFEEAIEKIDIGGPSLIRAAAKNLQSKTVLIAPDQYNEFISEIEANSGSTSLEFRRKCAIRAFQHTARYNTIIAKYLEGTLENDPGFSDEFTFEGRKLQTLRYGENPHQKAAFYSSDTTNPLNDFEQLHGKELSYNNILDLDAALSIVLEFKEDAFVTILKHNNPCGAAWQKDQLSAYKYALATDPISAFGGIVGFNQIVTGEVAEEMRSHFFECIIAPDFSAEAMEIFTKKKNLRLVKYKTDCGQKYKYQIRSVRGGFLIQETDDFISNVKEAKVVTKRKPTDNELKDLQFAWKIGKHVHSNAIVFTKNSQLIGVGAGQMSRVDAAELAITKAKNAENSTSKTVVASDAFFPFRDGLDVIAKAGATAVAQPGGSVRDEEVIAAADEHNIAMIFTGHRHFKH